jgi:hypothetical protein
MSSPDDVSMESGEAPAWDNLAATESSSSGFIFSSGTVKANHNGVRPFLSLISKFRLKFKTSISTKNRSNRKVEFRNGHLAKVLSSHLKIPLFSM